MRSSKSFFLAKMIFGYCLPFVNCFHSRSNGSRLKAKRKNFSADLCVYALGVRGLCLFCLGLLILLSLTRKPS